MSVNESLLFTFLFFFLCGVSYFTDYDSNKTNWVMAINIGLLGFIGGCLGMLL